MRPQLAAILLLAAVTMPAYGAESTDTAGWHLGKNVERVKAELEERGWNNRDSIAAKGAIARGVINAADWWRCTFDTYDTTYVGSVKYKAKVQLLEDNWIDSYSLDLESGKPLRWRSPFTATIGASASYLGISLGFNIDISESRKRAPSKRKVFSFELSKSRVNLRVRYIRNVNDDNNLEQEIISPGLPDLRLDGITNKIWDIAGYYIFNHRHYCQSAAYSYSKVQRRSSGSLLAGFSIMLNNVRANLYDPNGRLPLYSELSGFRLLSNNYTAIVGYGYNWVPARNFVVNVTACPSIGWRYGHETSADGTDVSAYSFALGIHSRAAVTYAWRHLVFSLQGHFYRELYHRSGYSFRSQVANFGLKVCYRF